MNISFKFSVCLSFALATIFFSACHNSGGGILKGDPPCTIYRSCIVVELDNNVCRTDTSGNTHNFIVAINKNPEDISATFIKEYLDRETRTWLAVDPKTYSHLRRLPGKKSVTRLGCSYEKIGNLDREIRYLLDEACKDNDPNCRFSPPDNSDIHTSSCTSTSKCDSCIEIDYAELTEPTQKAAVSELYTVLLNKLSTPYQFKNDFASAFSLGSPSGASCTARTTAIANKILKSNGTADCQSNIYITPSIQLNDLNDSYSKMWITVPPSVEGLITKLSSKIGTLTLNKADERSVRIIVELEKSLQPRTDLLSTVTAYYERRTLVMQGDFICVKIKHIPKVD